MTLATVCVFNYNNSAFIAEALESVLAQKTDFEVEILVGDDASTDNSCDVVREIQSKNPGRIHLLETELNLGGTRNWLRTIEAAKGEFIFTLDADDYFTNDKKLQSQVDALQSDSTLSMAFHSIIEERSLLGADSLVVDFESRRHTLEDFFRIGWYMPTGSLCFRSELLRFPFPDWVHDYPYRIDSVIHVMLLMQGDSHYDGRAMSAWRRHPEAVSMKVLGKNILQSYFEGETFAWQLHQFSGSKFEPLLRERLRREATSALVNALGRDLRVLQQRDAFRVFFDCDKGYLFERISSKIKRSFSKLRS